ncbi:unnamed protein product [Darwinula stevensoni]|uniref:Kringle domain-containing protein n=1 Tax=Darwinula stevensoni TaxID=69355 RepID=A0A7R9A8V9_9CRUS|nr:unnamed protein product [Darwinula stevensoni]CAG0896611.1 unnamed protein product [Darwinula stevensoni]
MRVFGLERVNKKFHFQKNKYSDGFTTEPPECKMTQQGGEYLGTNEVTHAGLPCRPWGNSWKPPEIPDCCGSGFPDEEVDGNHNLCRNPNGEAAPWCYSEENGQEFCAVPFCAVKFEEGDGLYPECRLKEKGKEYVGTKNETETGRPCLPWDSQSHREPWGFSNSSEIAYKDHFLNRDLSIHKNYCRNPGFHRERPWCFVSDPNVQWEYCDVPFCRDLDPPECKLTGKGGEYVGRRSVTISGFPCMHWLSIKTTMSVPLFKYFLSASPDEVDGSHNFCRSIGLGTHGPWCFSSLPTGPRIEYCDVPFCPESDGKLCDIRVSGKCISSRECRTTPKGLEYMGTKSTTKSGYPCQPWMSNTPNNQELKAHYSSNFGASFPDDLHPSHNFCRNPTSDPKGPWCYNGAGKKPSTDYCDIPFC